MSSLMTRSVSVVTERDTAPSCHLQFSERVPECLSDLGSGQIRTPDLHTEKNFETRHGSDKAELEILLKIS